AQSELLMSSLLSPVGGGPLSQFVSEQEYSKLFEKDGLGLSAFSEYRSDGQLRAVASQYGTSGNIGYALDGEYRYSSGVRQNNSFSNFESTGTFKLQLGLSDSIFLQVGALKLRTGDVSQYEYPKSESLKYHLDEDQNPGVLMLGWHREWSPGNHTLLLLGRLAASQTVTTTQGYFFVNRDVAGRVIPGPDTSVQQFFNGTSWTITPHFEVLRPLVGGTVLDMYGAEAFDLHYRNETEIYSAELQQIAKLETHSLVVGGRYQAGAFRTNTRMDYATIDPSTNQLDSTKQYYEDPAAQQSENIGFERVSLYAYDTWHAAPWLSLTGGVTYDAMRYPDNFRAPPINGREATLDRVSPKAGAILQPWSGATLRGAYAEAISGTSLEESYRLEPSQVSGLLQAYRTISPESLLGSVEGSRYTFSGLGFEQKLPTRTYLGIDYQSLSQNVDRTLGVFDGWATFEGEYFGFTPSSLAEKDRYQEKSITATLNQLVGRNWALGASYRRTQSSLRVQYPEIDASIANSQSIRGTDFMARFGDNLSESVLHTICLQAHYNHPSGFFAQGEANWYRQTSEAWGKDGSGSYYDDNLDLQKIVIPRHDILPSYDFWQFNALAGYRFYRNRCEVSCGVLNIAGKDYLLNTLNPNEELPRERTFVVRCRVSF
ncbi:MAG: TonB-dependent receptor, partial [Verrucomicrobiota bacterium]